MESSVFGLMLQVLLLAFVFGMFGCNFFKHFTDNRHLFINYIIHTDSIVFGAEVPKTQYAVVFDAGSSGTKLLAYKFEVQYPAGKLVLKDEIFEKDKPGLSAHSQNPEKAVASITGLLVKAKAFVPEDFRSSTPLVLKATAGLRMLPQNEADNLLKAVRDVLAKSGFLVKEDAVEIMDGVDEGLYSWFTVNILMGIREYYSLFSSINIKFILRSFGQFTLW